MSERFPFDPLIPIIEARYRQPNDADGTHYGAVGVVSKTVNVTGIARGRVQGWQRRGLNLRAADEIACVLGLHGSIIWPEQWRATVAAEPQPQRRAKTPAA